MEAHGSNVTEAVTIRNTTRNSWQTGGHGICTNQPIS